MILSGIHDFKHLKAGFPIRTASGMTFCETVNHALRKKPARFAWRAFHIGKVLILRIIRLNSARHPSSILFL
jgi:hypothetical protein